MLSVSILEMYAVQFESLVKLPKRANKVKAFNKEVGVANAEESNNGIETQQINYFAGPHCVFTPTLK